MTVSAIDDMAPGRVLLGMGTGLPLRLGQMGIPYSPDAGLEAVSNAIDTMRALWSGERVPPGQPGLPPVQPMFPPVHRVPVYIAAYRSAFLWLAGAKADGYLARPAESIASLRRMLETLRAASVAAGRPEGAVEVAGYLLTLVDRSRREALNRAKREPFVIYMMIVHSDLAMRRAGLDPELKDRVAAAWRAEDYHLDANLIPDDLLDAFMLCVTMEEVAAGAAAYNQAGMGLPLLQPVLQTEDQVREVLATAVEYGQAAHAPAAAPAAPVGPVGPSAVDPSTAAAEHAGGASEATVGAERRQVGAARRVGVARRVGAWVEIARPFSFTASTVPVAAGGALAALDGRLDWPLFVAALIAAVLLHVGTNITNEIYDVRKGIDSITSPRASHALLKGRLSEHEAFALAATAFAGSMAIGSYYVSSGTFTWAALVASVPVGLLVTAILHGNEWRDVSEDARAGISTMSIRAGRRFAHELYLALVIGAYLVLALAVAVGALPPLSLLAMLSLPLLVRAVRASELGATGQQRAIAMLDLETAQLHAAFGFLLVVGLAIAAV